MMPSPLPPVLADGVESAGDRRRVSLNPDSVPVATAHARRADSSAAASVPELERMLARYQQQLHERRQEKDQLVKYRSDFSRHIQWQKQQQTVLKRNIQQLSNETRSLDEKLSNVRQQTQLIDGEVRQCRAEVDGVKEEREQNLANLELASEELRLENEAAVAAQSLCIKATNALALHKVKLSPNTYYRCHLPMRCSPGRCVTPIAARCLHIPPPAMSGMPT